MCFLRVVQLLTLRTPIITECRAMYATATLASDTLATTVFGAVKAVLKQIINGIEDRIVTKPP